MFFVKESVADCVMGENWGHWGLDMQEFQIVKGFDLIHESKKDFLNFRGYLIGIALTFKWLLKGEIFIAGDRSDAQSKIFY